jgi:hypothetical protein
VAEEPPVRPRAPAPSHTTTSPPFTPIPPSQLAAEVVAKRAARVQELEARGLRANRMRSPDSPQPLRVDPSTGMPIYSADALKIGQGKGDTPLCPFDCECCY